MISAHSPHLRITTDKQFNYQKLVNEKRVQIKPDRPPPPQIKNTEGILIDISPEDKAVINETPNVGNYGTSRSLIDEPIDIPEFEGEFQFVYNSKASLCLAHNLQVFTSEFVLCSQFAFFCYHTYVTLKELLE